MAGAESGGGVEAWEVARPAPRRGTLSWFVGLGVYLAWTWAMVGLRIEHVALAAVVAGLVCWPRGRRYALLVLPVGMTLALYDSLPLALPLRGPVHVADLYRAELQWFGLAGDTGAPATLPEYFAAHHWPVLDVLCGLAYLLYLPEVFGAILVYSFVELRLALAIAWSFLGLNVVGMLIYLVYPSAPPWYVMQYGLGPAILDVPPSAAGAARFDAMVGVSYFASFYSRNINVFGAMPSLHCAYPTMLLALLGPRNTPWLLVTAVFWAWISFAAVYLQHHYVLDVLGGWACGAMAACSARLWLRPREARPELIPVGGAG